MEASNIQTFNKGKPDKGKPDKGKPDKGQTPTDILLEGENLIPANLVPLLPKMALTMADRGHEEAARSLQLLAASLNSETISGSPEMLAETTLGFLLRLLQATLKSNGNPKIVWGLLGEKPGKITFHFVQVLRSWGTLVLSGVPPKEAAIIGNILVEFGGFVYGYKDGDETMNIEIAIAAAETVLPVFSTRESRCQWATLHNNLALAYSDRLYGERLENIPIAYSHYDEAKRLFFQRQGFPKEWISIFDNSTEVMGENTSINKIIPPINRDAA
jgi:hypothetical protein